VGSAALLLLPSLLLASWACASVTDAGNGGTGAAVPIPVHADAGSYAVIPEARLSGVGVVMATAAAALVAATLSVTEASMAQASARPMHRKLVRALCRAPLCALDGVPAAAAAVQRALREDTAAVDGALWSGWGRVAHGGASCAVLLLLLLFVVPPVLLPLLGIVAPLLRITMGQYWAAARQLRSFRRRGRHRAAAWLALGSPALAAGYGAAQPDGAGGGGGGGGGGHDMDPLSSLGSMGLLEASARGLEAACDEVARHEYALSGLARWAGIRLSAIAHLALLAVAGLAIVLHGYGYGPGINLGLVESAWMVPYLGAALVACIEVGDTLSGPLLAAAEQGEEAAAAAARLLHVGGHRAEGGALAPEPYEAEAEHVSSAGGEELLKNFSPVEEGGAEAAVGSQLEFVDVCMRYRPLPAPLAGGLGGGAAALQPPLALDGVSFAAMPGELTGLVGRRGSGKSAVVHALLRLAPLERGAVLFNGWATAAVGVALLRQALAVVPQVRARAVRIIDAWLRRVGCVGCCSLLLALA
jgi:ABC-type multidrug transport system fused ATPase/permease subunit